MRSRLAKNISLLVLCTIPLQAGCELLSQVFAPPEVKFDSARFQAPDFQQLRVDLVLKITNPNPLGGRLSGYSINFNVDGLTLLDGDIDQDLDLSAGATTELILPVTLKWAELANKITQGKPARELPYRAAGDLKVGTPIGEIAVPFNIEGKLPVLQPPLVVPAGLRVVRTSLTGMDLAMDFKVTNPSTKPIGLVDFKHQILLQGRAVGSGQLADRLPVPAGATEIRTVELSLSTLEAGAALFTLLSGGQGTQVQVGFKGSCDVQTGIGLIPLNFNSADGIRLGN